MTKISNSNNKKTLKKKLKQIGGSDSINVLTWNICWQAMKGEQATNGSANDLAGTCSSLTNQDGNSDELNGCVKNVINLIDKLPIDYDFVALQEPAKWKAISDNSTKLKTMGYVHHRTGSTSELVTFYNKEKYLALGVIADTFTYNGKRGRPYHIIFFKNKITGEFYIFINLHNAHNMPKNELERQLASNFNKFKIIEKVKQEHAEQLTAIMEIDKNNNYNVIVAGDFNDDGTMNYWQGFKPFKNTNIPSLKDLEVKCNAKPPNTCCRQVNSVQPDKSGDYILVNNTLTIEEPNYIPPISNNFFPSSDHMPVLIKLKTPVIGVMTRQRARLLQGQSTQRQTTQTQIQTQIQTQQTQRQYGQRHASPRQASPRQASPRQASPRQASPRQALPISEASPPEPIEKTESSIEHTEANSSNMFSAPLMAMIFAIPIIFLLNK